MIGLDLLRVLNSVELVETKVKDAVVASMTDPMGWLSDHRIVVCPMFILGLGPMGGERFKLNLIQSFMGAFQAPVAHCEGITMEQAKYVRPDLRMVDWEVSQGGWIGME